MGGAHPLDPDVLDDMMLAALEQVYTQVWDWDHYEHTWTTTVPANSRVADTGGGEIPFSTLFNPRYTVMHRVRRSDGVEVTKSTHYPEDGTATAAPTDPKWFHWGDQLLFTPLSTTGYDYTFYGYREVNRTLYTEPTPGTITWQQVDLPNRVIEIFQFALQGFILMACGDPAGAQLWLRSASDALVALNNLNNGEGESRVPTVGALRMGGDPRNAVWKWRENNPFPNAPVYLLGEVC